MIEKIITTEKHYDSEGKLIKEIITEKTTENNYGYTPFIPSNKPIVSLLNKPLDFYCEVKNK